MICCSSYISKFLSFNSNSYDYSYSCLQTRIPAPMYKLLCLLVNVTIGSKQDKSFLVTGGLGLPVRHSGGAPCQSCRICTLGDNCRQSNHRQTSTSPAPQRISDCISRRKCWIVMRKSAAIYEFYGESEFEIEG